MKTNLGAKHHANKDDDDDGLPELNPETSTATKPPLAPIFLEDCRKNIVQCITRIIMGAEEISAFLVQPCIIEIFDKVYDVKTWGDLYNLAQQDINKDSSYIALAVTDSAKRYRGIANMSRSWRTGNTPR